MPSPRAQPDSASVAALVVALLAVSSSGPLIAYAAAPAIAIAFWRNAMAVAVLAPVALVGRRRELAGLVGAHRREGLFCVLAGVALGVHFALWVPSVKLTTVATATALVATQPVWQGLIAVAQGRRLPSLTWVGVATAVVGAAVATGADVAVSSTAVLGDLMAVGGGIAAAVYTALGERARTTTSTTSYTAVCYTVSSGVLLGVCLATRAPLGGYPTTAWIALIGLTVGPQLLGHSFITYALRRIAATTVSVLILLEVPGAALLGWAWLGQVPRVSSLPGLALLVVGVVIVVIANRRSRAATAAARRTDPLTGVRTDQSTGARTDSLTGHRTDPLIGQTGAPAPEPEAGVVAP